MSHVACPFQEMVIALVIKENPMSLIVPLGFNNTEVSYRYIVQEWTLSVSARGRFLISVIIHLENAYVQSHQIY